MLPALYSHTHRLSIGGLLLLTCSWFLALSSPFLHFFARRLDGNLNIKKKTANE